MQLSPQPDPVSPEAMELGYEPESVPVRGLLLFFVLVVASAVFLHLLIWKVMKRMEAHNSGVDAPRSLHVPDPQTPAPRLQPSVGHDATEQEDLKALRRREDETFTKLGWAVRPGDVDPEIPPEIIRRVAEEQRARAAAPFVPPTTTGRNSNSIVPTTVPAGDTRPGAQGDMP